MILGSSIIAEAVWEIRMIGTLGTSPSWRYMQTNVARAEQTYLTRPNYSNSYPQQRLDPQAKQIVPFPLCMQRMVVLVVRSGEQSSQLSSLYPHNDAIGTGTCYRLQLLKKLALTMCSAKQYPHTLLPVSAERFDFLCQRLASQFYEWSDKLECSDERSRRT